MPVTPLSIVPRLRQQEQWLRSGVLYEAAVTIQRRADIIEQAGEYPSCPSYMDRGTAAMPDCYLLDDLLIVPSSDGAVTLGFTKDRAEVLLMYTAAYLGFSMGELVDLEHQLWKVRDRS